MMMQRLIFDIGRCIFMLYKCSVWKDNKDKYSEQRLCIVYNVEMLPFFSRIAKYDKLKKM